MGAPHQAFGQIRAERSEQLADAQAPGLGGEVGVEQRAVLGGADDGHVEHVGPDVVGDVLALALPGDGELGAGEHAGDRRGQVGMFDGSVRTLGKLPGKETLHALITRAGGEVIAEDFE